MPGKPNPPEVRFRDHITYTVSGCWNWTGSLTPAGYGYFYAPGWTTNKRDWMAVHRFAYLHLVGPIPDGHEIDHLCCNRRCVNPDHLEAVTRLENVRRSRGNQYANRSHCDRGHEYTPENTRWIAGWKGNPKRVCRACQRGRIRARL